MYRSSVEQGRLRHLLSELWEWIAGKLGLKENIRSFSPEQLQNMNLGELAEGAAKGLLGGKRISGNPSWGQLAKPKLETAPSFMGIPLKIPEF